MTDDTTTTPAQPGEPVAAGAALVDEQGNVQAVGSIAVQDNYAVIVAQFADMDAAKQAYYNLVDAEVKGAVEIEGVLVANADYQGKVHIQKMTDHTTRHGLKWGIVAGVVVGIIFPPTILASAATLGVAGAVVGKAGNELKRSAMADELTSVLTPGTSGIVALVAITAVDAVEQSMPEAKVVKSVPVDDDTAETVKTAAKAAGDASAG